MVKKGSWFSAIKKVFSPHSKEKLGNEPERKSGNEKKKKGFGKRRHGETNSFLPLFREPSSIEKILGEAERDHNLVFRPPTPERPNQYSASPPQPPRSASPRAPSPRSTSPRVTSTRAASPKPPSPRDEVPRSLSPKPPSPRDEAPRSLSPKPPSPRPDLPRSRSPKSSDRLKPSSTSANTLPLRPASPGDPSQRISPPSVPSPRPSSPRGASPQTVSLKPPSPGAEPSTLEIPRPPSPKHLSPRADPPRLEVPRPTTPKPPSPRADASRLDVPRPTTPKPPSPRADSPRFDAPRPTTPKPPSPRTVSPRAVHRREIFYRPEPTLSVKHASATKIQGAFRGYMARKSFRALKGLVRLQGVVRGYSVKRQTINAMKYMQQVVRVQSQIQSRRIKKLENQAQIEKDEAKWAASETGNWDDSVLTKEERDARSQRKTEAIIKRERSMAYAYSRKFWKNSPKYIQDNRSSGGFPQWWNWGDRQYPLASPVPSYSQPLRDFRLTPSRLCPSPLSQSSKQHHFRPGTSTPKSLLLTPSRPGTSRYSRGGLRGQDSPFKDDDSLTSCPPFPSYMAPTASAMAKLRPNSNPKERVTGTPVSEKRRMSYPPMQQGHDTFRWNKGSLLISNSSSHKFPGSPGGVVLEKHKTLKSVGNLSIGSAGRREFNRFV